MGKKITLSHLYFENFVFVHSLFFVTFIVRCAVIIVCACAFCDRRVRPRDSVQSSLYICLISQVKLAVYQFSYFLERSTLVTVMVPRKIVLHLLLLLSKQGI